MNLAKSSLVFYGIKIPNHTVVLLGVGHTNAHIVKMWRMHPILGARLVCVSNFRRATYSGMLPGVLAGQYAPDEMAIDLTRLCQSANVELVMGEVVGLSQSRDALLFADRPPLSFDVLSIGIGSVPSFHDVRVSDDTSLLTISRCKRSLSDSTRLSIWRSLSVLTD